ncbi:EAL domain-containing protein [Epibacterium sp. DP7N7-1]|nr:EAL domain-containing protein [Epibacterium sp. DP7N7-1]
MSEIDAVWMLISALLVLVLQSGFLCLESGTVRTKNAANVALKNMADVCVVSTCFWLVGFGLMFGTSFGGLFGTGGFLPQLDNATGHSAAIFLFQMAFAATATTIVSGAVAERERFLGYMIVSIALSAFIYPIAGHWIWNEAGWLRQLGFIDFAGATVVHSVGGWTALVAVIFLGPRLGRYGRKNRFFEENSISLVTLGGLLLWVGWGAFNGGSALAFNTSVGPVIARTMLSAAGAGLASIAIGLGIFRCVRAELLVNGFLGGLVASTAGIHLISGPTAFLIGAAGAVAVIVARDILDALEIDDVVGAIPVHLAAGLLGTLAVAFAAPLDALPAGSRIAQLGVQAFGAAVVGIWVISCMTPLILLLKARGLLRARPRDEVRGLNLAENNQRNMLLELLEEMKRHQRTGSFSSRVRIERSSELGVLAYRYNRVLDRVEEEIDQRMASIRKERMSREMAEEAFEAMRAAQEESAWSARHDKLTGLGNRKHLEETASAPATAQQAGTLVIALDLDRFKYINDTYGHEVGDLVLEQAARRISDKIQPGCDFAFRIGGDEFALLVEFSGSEAEAFEYCSDLLFELLQPVRYKDVELEVGVSIGFALCEPGETLLSALRRADLALYASKADGRSCVNAYSTDIGAAHDEKMDLIRDFKQAFRNDEIKVTFQPQIDGKTGAIAGCEALARWHHPKRGIVGPDVFVSVAKEVNMLAELDRRILDLALAAYWEFTQHNINLPSISVNVSAERLGHPGLIEELKQRTDLPASGLAFELLETVFLDHVDEDYAKQIDALKAMGIGIEIDDFGTGHASIAGVLALRPDRLKIDRMFTTGIDSKPARRDLMRGLIEMATSAGAATVVEGVETEAEAKILSDLGADVLQGYAFARPMDRDSFLTWAQDWNSGQSFMQAG